MNLGWVKYNLGQFKDAISLDIKALDLFEQAHASESFDAILLRSNLGLSYIAIGDYERATTLLEKALNIQQNKGKTELINAMILNNMSLISRQKSQYSEEVSLLEQALVIYSQFEPQKGSYTVIILKNLATALKNLTNTYRELGDYKGLLSTQEKMVDIDKKIYGPINIETVNAMSASAATLMTIGRYDDASSLFKAIEEIYAKNAPTSPMRFYTLMLQGGVLYKLGDIRGANLFLNKTLVLTQKTLGNENAITNIIMGATAFLDLQVGKVDEAARLSSLMKTFFEKTPQAAMPSTQNPLNELGLQLSLFLAAKVKVAQDKPLEAIPLEAKSLSLDYISSFSNNFVIADRLNELSKTMYKVNRSSAIALSKLGINIFQSLRHDISASGAKNLDFFTKSIKDRYQSLAEMLIKEGRLDEAQEVIGLLKLNEFNQYTRSANNQDPLSNHLTFTLLEQGLISPYEVILDKIVHQSIKLKELNAINAISKTQPDKNLTEALVNQLNKNQEAFIEYIKSMAEDVSKKSTAETQSTPVSLAHLKQLQELIKLSGPDVALLSYYLVEDSLGVIITGANGQFSKNVSVNSTELNKKIANFNQLLRNPKLDPRPAAEDLYKLVFKPLVGDLEKIGATTLMLSLDGILRYIPFAALHDGKHYLVESYKLPIFTSATSDTLNATSSPPWKVSAMGVTHSIRDFPALPGVQAEVDGIVRHGSEGILPGEILLDNNFTSLALKEATKQNYPVLHIASHFVFSPGTEVNSFLLMGDGQELTLGDIRTQNFDFSHVDLLTLSACETGMGGGVDDDGREIEGFGVTAQRQGAKSVLATLWPVADKSTAILMKDFYQLHQEQKLSKAEALRKAQLHMLNGTQDHIVADKKGPSSTHFNVDPKKPYAHPFYWAPFILMGNWN
jgi:CHAT domain-containing protein